MSLVKTSGGGKPGNGEDGYAFDGQVSLALAQIWEIFDYPCGQRLKSILETELIRLMNLGELLVSEDVALKLKMISPATIDRKLKHQREVLHPLRSKGGPKPGSLPGCQIPIRLTQCDTSEELALMDDLYRNELRLYKNFFQPVMKIKRKERIYLNLNPAELKRAIDAKLDKLYRAYERKSRSGQVDPSKKVVPHSVTNYMIDQSPVGLHG